MPLESVVPAVCLAVVAALCVVTVSAQRVDVVPLQSEFTAVVSGGQWPRVLFRLRENSRRNSSLPSSATGASVLSGALTQMLATALNPAPHNTAHPSTTGVIAVFLTGPLLASRGALQASFAVVRMVGAGSLAAGDASLLAQIEGADVAELRSVYKANGGSPMDDVAVHAVRQVYVGDERCSESCAWAVGVAAPLLATALLLIPTFMSVVHLERGGTGPEFVLVASHYNGDEDQEINEFANCADWGPVKLVDPDLLRQQKAARSVARPDGLVVVQHEVVEAPSQSWQGAGCNTVSL
ncbi:uncharacterized protein Tco025E_08870 [Trypanosoma conorhini]|uniref:Uncharacterized protein n=1 Tax=Trypanosoma conorhini TaxID=83891 RepID=A0A3R7MCZ1_9TRYP|nr:uncharacterized protein Tco025E_08870 [Trypanosoma conorhini]RNF00311.1 hypothetical protein Tco025E_08870 [Trypanosoma conorhini]